MTWWQKPSSKVIYPRGLGFFFCLHVWLLERRLLFLLKRHCCEVQLQNTFPHGARGTPAPSHRSPPANLCTRRALQGRPSPDWTGRRWVETLFFRYLGRKSEAVLTLRLEPQHPL